MARSQTWGLGTCCSRSLSQCPIPGGRAISVRIASSPPVRNRFHRFGIGCTSRRGKPLEGVVFLVSLNRLVPLSAKIPQNASKSSNQTRPTRASSSSRLVIQRAFSSSCCSCCDSLPLTLSKGGLLAWSRPFPCLCLYLILV